MWHEHLVIIFVRQGWATFDLDMDTLKAIWRYHARIASFSLYCLCINVVAVFGSKSLPVTEKGFQR